MPGHRLPSLLIAAALVAVTATAYRPALGGDFIWDDDDYVSNNVALRSAEGLRAIWLDPRATPQYYPLVHTSYWLEYRAWGLEPAGYHLTNLVLHLVSALIVWRIARLLALPGPWLIAAIFAVHPVHVESVAWITERKNVLSGVFYLSAMLTYLHLALDSGGLETGRRRLLYSAAFVLFVGALLSKTVTASLPAALLLVIWWKRGRVSLTDVWPLIPFFAVGLAMGALTIWLEREHVGAAGAAWQLSPLERVVIAGRALWFHTGTLLWPSQLAFMYPRWEIDATSPRQLAWPLAVLVVLSGFWLARRRIGRGPIVAVLFFAGTLVPALGFFDVFPMRYTFVADHYQYLASLGLIALGVAAAVRGLDGRVTAGTRFAGGAIVVLVLASLTWRQSHAYADHETLWRDTVTKAPDSWMAHVSLGALLERRGALPDAEVQYREAVRLNPSFGIARINLGALLANQGRFGDAIPHMREAVRLEPDLIDTHLSLGRALLYAGRADEAVAALSAALAKWPDSAPVRELLQQATAITAAASPLPPGPGRP